MHKEKIAKGATKGQMQVNVQYSGIKWGKEKRKKVELSSTVYVINKVNQTTLSGFV